MEKYLLECCVDSVESALAAKEGGADRLELCVNLIIGGTTPGIPLLSLVKDSAALPVHALIRPRFGDFLYSDYELDIIGKEIKGLCEAGADGIVIGCLKPDGELDKTCMAELIKNAPGKHITLHRAFDMCRNPLKALEEAKALGIHTILTSGGKNSCIEGMELLKKLSACAEGVIDIMAGGGVNAEVIQAFRKHTDIHSYHMSGKKIEQSHMEYRNPQVNMGLKGLSEYELWRTDTRAVRLAKESLLKGETS